MSVMPPVAALPALTLQDGVEREQLDVSYIVNCFLAGLEQNIGRNELEHLSDLFIEDCWWRDVAALSWDITTKHEPAVIAKYLAISKSGLCCLSPIEGTALGPQFVDMSGLIWIQSGFTFETKYGNGKGIVRLVNVGPAVWKAWTVSTTLMEMKGQEKNLDNLREAEFGTESEANRQTEPGTEDLQVLIVGAGQSGLSLAAHMKHLGLKYLIVDKASEIGSVWGSRWTSVRAHTPKWSDHYPFLEFPEDWPTWLDQDHIVDWMRHYQKTLDLNVLFNSTVTDQPQWDPSSRKWSVIIKNGDKTQVLQTKHLVLATGLISQVPIIPEFNAQDSYKGRIYHSCQHKSAENIENLASKNVTIIGASSTAHDIAQNFVEKGAKSVSMVQRHPIWSVSLDSTEKFQLSLWNTPGISTEDADILALSFPTHLARNFARAASPVYVQHDKALMDGLEKAGMALRRGEDGISLLDCQLIFGGRFYIDQGAAPMISDGRIQIKMCEGGVKEFYGNGIILADGRQVESDIVVLATGYQRHGVNIAELMGDDVIRRTGVFGALDHEGERNGWWRATGVPGFWFMTGSFIWCRQFSRILALQIAGVEKGLVEGHYDL